MHQYLLTSSTICLFVQIKKYTPKYPASVVVPEKLQLAEM